MIDTTEELGKRLAAQAPGGTPSTGDDVLLYLASRDSLTQALGSVGLDEAVGRKALEEAVPLGSMRMVYVDDEVTHFDVVAVATRVDGLQLHACVGAREGRHHDWREGLRIRQRHSQRTLQGLR